MNIDDIKKENTAAVEVETDEEGAFTAFISEEGCDLEDFLDEDGCAVAVRVDTTGDGYNDTIFIDEDGDGEPDVILKDTNCDGNFDTTIILNDPNSED